MTALVEFLLARIAEAEAWITGEGGEHLDECQECAFGQQPESPFSRARILAECEAKRRIVEELTEAIAYDEAIHEGTTTTAVAGERVLNWLALPYADHPGYDETWQP